jgi:outer membrane protein
LRLNISEAINKGVQSNMELRSESAKVNQALADIDRVHGEFGPRIEGKAGLGPTTKATGNALSSRTQSNRWGAIFLGQLEFTQPIFTWGRKTDYLRAADLGVVVRREDLRLREIELRYQIKEAYYGSLYAGSLLDFIREGKKDIEAVESELAKKIGKEDRFRLDILQSQILGKEAEVERAHKVALAGLALRVGAKTGEEIAPAEDWIENAERKIEPVEHYLKLARAEKPEYRQLEAGITAKKALASAEWKASLPVLALLARYDFAYTAAREDQQSIYAYDPFNQDNFVVGLGVKWDIQWGLPAAKAAKFSAEAVELEAKQSYAQDGLSLLVRKAWLELIEAEAKLKASRDGAKAAKKWLAHSLIGVSSGLGDVRKIVDAYQARAATLKDSYEAIFEHHLAWARLSQAVGVEVDPLILERI